MYTELPETINLWARAQDKNYDLTFIHLRFVVTF
jgi:hypothetical protein